MTNVTVVRTSLRSLVAHRGRMVLSGTAVVLSVAFVCGTLVFTSTMNTTFDKLFAETASNVMIGPAANGERTSFDEPPTSGRPDTLPASVADQVTRVDGVARVTGTVSATSVVAVDEAGENIGPTTGAPTIATTWSPIELRAMTVSQGHPPHGPGEIMVDEDTADAKNLAIGDRLRLLTVFGDFHTTVTGIAAFQITNPGATVVHLDVPTAQRYLLGGADAFTELYVDSDGQLTDAALRDRIADATSDRRLTLRTADEYIEAHRDDLAQVMDVIQYVLLGFAGIAVLVGAFLIVNTFSMLVAQRTREIGLLRALGASRRQVNSSVLVEALALGALGSAAGFGAGIGLAIGLMALMRTLGVRLSTDDLTIAWWVPVVGAVLGVLVTLLAAYLPARRAGRVTPMAALRDPGTPGELRAGRRRAAAGTALTLAGGAALLATARADSTATGAGLLSLGVVLSLVGLILVAPALVGLVVRGLGAALLRGFGPVGRLAQRNALRNPRRTGATASALMIGLALVAGLTVVGSSMVASASDEIDRSVGADFILTTADFSPVLPDAAAAARDARHLARVTELRTLDATVTTPDGDTFDQALGASQTSYLDDLSVDVVDGDLAAAFETGGVAVDADTADRHGLRLGDRLTVDFDDGDTATLTVRAVLAGDTFLQVSTWQLALSTAKQYVDDADMPLPTLLFATAREGQQDQARAALEAALKPYPQMEVRDQAEFKDLIQSQVGQLLNMVYGLLTLAIIVAILGVVNTLALAVVERTREIGLLRAIGLARPQLRRMIRLESVLIALFGALLGLGLGLGWGAAAHRLLVLEGMEVLDIPWPTILTVFVGSAVVGLIAALIPAHRAARLNILTAIATE